MSLKIYKKKRDFKKTPEPSGKAFSHKKPAKLAYLVQKHAASHLHYDFRLELNGVLISWAVPKGPCLDPNVKRLAMHVEDHPLDYGSFEGNIPQGEYGGGAVILWDNGFWTPLDESPTTAYKKGAMHFLLHGKKLKGKWRLFRINKDDKTWLLVKYEDEYARPLKEFDVVVEKPKSITTNRTIDEIRMEKKPVRKKKPQIDLSHLIPKKLPKMISPQLATLVSAAPEGNDWYHELKFDGYRILAFKNNKQIKLMTRNYNDWTNAFESIAKEIKTLPLPNLILDGEVVVLDDKQHANFQLLQNSIKQNTNRPFIYYVFDILYYDKYNLTELPLSQRKNILENAIKPFESETLRYSDHVVGSGSEVFKKACAMGLEGIVSKKATSSYQQQRNKNWLKVKCSKRQEFVIGGFTPPQGTREHFGSLLLGTYNKKKELIYNGNVGTGFTQASLKSLYAKLKQNISPTMYFKHRPPASNKVIWVKPNLVCEVEFSDWTSEGYLRHPSFKGLRQDKAPKEIKKEIAIPLETTKMATVKNPLQFKITNPKKILYPKDGITKQEIMAYYETIAPWILPYLIARPISLFRCPNGIERCFFQKHKNDATPDILNSIEIQEKHTTDTYLYIEDKEGLLTLVQLATLEIHCWNSTIHAIEQPDMLVFDLDPAPDVAWKKVVYAAKEIKAILAEINLKSFVKTTGGKGLHVVVPLKPKHNWDEIKQFTHTVAEYMVMKNPKDYVSQMSKAKRTGKIFVDYLRNSRGATSIAAYSTRARPGAPVATPLDWDELTTHREDTAFTIATLPERLENLKKDPWKEFFKIKQSLRLDDFKKSL